MCVWGRVVCVFATIQSRRCDKNARARVCVSVKCMCVVDVVWCGMVEGGSQCCRGMQQKFVVGAVQNANHGRRRAAVAVEEGIARTTAARPTAATARPRPMQRASERARHEISDAPSPSMNSMPGPLRQ